MRTLIAFHYGRKTKSESFVSCPSFLEVDVSAVVHFFDPCPSFPAHSSRTGAGGVRTLSAFHYGRNTNSESFVSCHGRVNIFGGSEEFEWNVMGIHCLLPFLRKF